MVIYGKSGKRPTQQQRATHAICEHATSIVAHDLDIRGQGLFFTLHAHSNLARAGAEVTHFRLLREPGLALENACDAGSVHGFAFGVTRDKASIDLVDRASGLRLNDGLWANTEAEFVAFPTANSSRSYCAGNCIEVIVEGFHSIIIARVS